jgi:AraC-like DNA-binding protein
MKSLDDHSTKGILYADSGKRRFRLTRYEPAEALRPFIERYWFTEWDLRGQAPYRQVILAHPNINMVIMPHNTRIYGISPTTSSQLLEDEGHALGIMFKPAGFYPFWEQPVSKLAGQSIDFREVFGKEAQSMEDVIVATGDEEKKVLLLESFLLARLPRPDEHVELLNEMIGRITTDRDILRVDDMVSRFGVTKRTLQRLFNRYVGTSPKWVIQRYRLHEAAERMEQGEVTDWTRLSLELGYYDQAHFIKDFKAMIGRSPEEYMKAMDEA